MEEKKKSAFPTQKAKHYGFGTDDPGMTLRDYFAAKAMQGLLSANATYKGRTDDYASLSQDAYNHADAMLTQRNKEPDQ
jgi:hypothetical protein